MSVITRPVCFFCEESVEAERLLHGNDYVPDFADVVYRGVYACGWHALIHFSSRSITDPLYGAVDIKPSEVFL